MPVTKVNSRWESGKLVFHEAGNYGDAAKILTLATDEVVFGVELDLTGSKVMLDFADGDESSKNPTSDTEAGWINVNVDGTKQYIPYYAAS